MTTALWVTVALAFCTVASNLVTGYLQQKQMRQIELHRRDSSISLKPPPHPVWVFLRKYWVIFLNIGFGVFFLFRGMAGRDPPTRSNVLDIAAGVFNLVLAWVSLVSIKIFDFTSNWLEKLMKEDLRLHEMDGSIISSLSRLLDKVSPKSHNVTGKLPPSKDK